VAQWLRLAAVIVFAAAADAAQRDAPGPPHRTDLAYDGQFTFVRLRWQSDLGFSRRARGCFRSTRRMKRTNSSSTTCSTA